MGELFRQYRPTSLEELANVDQFQISRKDFQELTDVVCRESHETLEALQREVEKIDRNIFPLDAYYTLQQILDEFDFYLKLVLPDQDLQERLLTVRQELDRKNPIGKIAAENDGYVLLHTADATSLQNILHTENDAGQICTTASSLRTAGDIFRSATKEAEAGLVYDPKIA